MSSQACCCGEIPVMPPLPGTLTNGGGPAGEHGGLLDGADVGLDRGVLDLVERHRAQLHELNLMIFLALVRDRNVHVAPRDRRRRRERVVLRDEHHVWATRRPGWGRRRRTRLRAAAATGERKTHRKRKDNSTSAHKTSSDVSATSMRRGARGSVRRSA